MAKADKAIPEETPIEAAPVVIQEVVAAQVAETPEQRDARLNREDYEKRDAEAWKERERIMGAPQPRDAEGAVRQRCGNCGF